MSDSIETRLRASAKAHRDWAKRTQGAGQLTMTAALLEAGADRIRKLEDAIREHRDSFSKDMDEHDWTTEDEALWALVEEVHDE